MERLLHYVWKNRLFPRDGLKTTRGEDIVVLSPGLHNKDAGPDFFSADVIIAGEDWMGNIEIHTRSSDWYHHGHDRDKAYNNVVLHVVQIADTDVKTESGRTLPQMLLQVPDHVYQNYEHLQAYEDYPPCYQFARTLPKIISAQWIRHLCEERLSRKADDIRQRLQMCEGNWEAVLFITMARAFGFNTNSDTFEQWARTIPYTGVAKHRDNLLQIEAMFFGQAGMLNEEWLNDNQRQAFATDPYCQRLKAEYKFLANKFQLTPMATHCWKFLRLRPQNFPTIRMAQFASLYYKQQLTLSAIIDAPDVKSVHKLLATEVSEYWRTHFSFGTEPTPPADRQIQAASLNLLIINAVIPVLYAYAEYRSSKKLKEKTIAWLRTIKPEDNKYIRLWEKMGQTVESAADTQAIIQLFRQYCERRDCLRCQIGYQYIKQKYAPPTSPSILTPTN